MHASHARFLSDKGIDYLREYLNLPAEIVPATLKKSNRPLERGPARGPGGDRPRREVGCEAAGAWGAYHVHAAHREHSVYAGGRLRNMGQVQGVLSNLGSAAFSRRSLMCCC